MTTENYNPFFRPLLIVIIVAFLAYLLSGCKTPAKMLRKHDKIQAKCEGKKSLDTVGASWCYTNYPVETKTTVKTKYVRGKTIVKTDTNTVTEIVKDTVVKTVTVNRWHTQVDTQYVDTSKVVIDSRKVELCRAELTGWIDKASKYKQKYETAQGKVKKRTWIAVIGWGVILLYIIFVIIRSRFNVFMNGLG